MKPVTLVRRALPFLALIILGIGAYDGWIFYSRWSSARSIEQQRSRDEADRARRTVQMLGGDELKILAFYAAPPSIAHGRSTSLCFGVNGAKTVRIDPTVVDDLHPSLSRCFQISPKRDTEYKLTASDGTGHSLTQSVTVQVR